MLQEEGKEKKNSNILPLQRIGEYATFGRAKYSIES
jgi:hypothetical protein